MLRRLIDSPLTYFVGAGLLVVVAIATQIEVRVPPLPEGTPQDVAELPQRGDLNVVFVVIDTLRADHLDVYGYGRETSPNLAALASQGIRFEKVLAQSSWTKTSMASLWTGAQPLNHGLLRFDDALPAEARMPAETLKQAGYRTAGIYRNGWVAPNFGFAQGFDTYIRPRPGRARQRAQSQHPAGALLEGTDEDALVSANEFLDAFGNEKFLLYLHLMDVHQYVFDQDSPPFGVGYLDLYDQAIHWTDRVIAHLYGKLEEIGVLDRTLFVITSDHGEAFREHGFEGHARNLYSEVTRVPWIIGLPFRLMPGVVVEQPVSNVDVWPTLLELLGLSPLEGIDGRSAVPLIRAAAGLDAEPLAPTPRLAFLDRGWGHRTRQTPIFAVEDAGKRIMWWPQTDESPERVHLFDTEGDPSEQHDIYSPGDDPDAERLLGIVREHSESAESPWGVDARQIELDEMRLNQLRALGYVLPGAERR
ncbi:MAG: sulfatase [Deltaproteobacteria bacterium]|nr:sulfatase [Deltaproteobacteria bacterium]MBW2359720.1 sulfatase [Deltaproteobacteria bacterium]